MNATQDMHNAPGLPWWKTPAMWLVVGLPAAVVVGGFLMLFGARIADGCTSGHGISGMAQLAVGSTVAVAAMFVGGIATATLVLRRI